ncbi:hypothetical protein HMPREF0044_0459 [Gleimia coleocanis DSM 15436]|uniref:EcsC family protein n=1 Tax=Gleimia coleocanis DSM 15436 TaxID=525245 RepID=C0VZ69_9ACTO|nr:hypothetical protein [Gleimia coleocanis]EEH64722.1 hypothetical protein HMPREF0044_0459 [Gleimia coleocanis DSM 15436]
MSVTAVIKSVPQKIASGASTVASAVGELRNVTDFASAIDVMVEAPQGYIERSVNQLRIENPTASPAEIIGILSRRFHKTASLSSSATGVAASVPGLGTVASLGVSSVQFATFLAQAGIYVLSVAHVYGIPTEDREMRRMLVMSSILGEDATDLVTAKLGFSSINMMRASFAQLGSNATAKVNGFLAKRLKKMVVRKGTTSILGKAMPFGIGAGIGYYVGHTMAHQVIKGTSQFLGPIPTQFAFPVTLEAKVTPVSAEEK